MFSVLITATVMAQPGKIFPAEWREFPSLVTDYTVVQLTTDKAEDIRLYFYNDGIVPAANSVVFSSTRTGRDNLFLINLNDGHITQVTDGRRIQGGSAVISIQKNEVYYFDSGALCATDLSTFKSRKLGYAIPAGYATSSSLTITDDGEWLGIGIVESTNSGKKYPTDFDRMRAKMDSRPWSEILLVRTSSGEVRKVHREKQWISHVMVHPQNPNLVSYCHEGPWEIVDQRLWFVNADGSDNHPVRVEARTEDRVGHEYWFPDGKRMGYQVSTDWPRKGIGILDIATGHYKEYYNATDRHTEVNYGCDLFVGDGRAEIPWINLYTISGDSLVCRHVFRHDDDFKRSMDDPHPSFLAKSADILFTSNRDGNTNVYLLRKKK
ncbi:MAG: oligogalacturonate lyase family protein [Ignavibacteriales bacterium]|nr:oligogalacturonate lyase family protein [Ignavibacteriales bacterium]